MTRSQYPAIPNASTDPASMLAAIQALTQSVNLLIVNSQPPTSQGLTAASQTFASKNELTSATNTLTGSLNQTTQAATDAQQAAAQAQATADAAHAGVQNLNPQVDNLNTVVASNFGLEGVISGTNFTVSGVTSLTGAPYTMIMPGSLLEVSTVTADQILDGSVTADAGQVSGGATATANLNLAVAGDVLVIASYTGTGTATPTGNGALIVKADGVDHTMIPLSSVGGNVMPATGFFLLSGVTAGAHTFIARAEFDGGPTDLNKVSIVAIALMR